MQRLRNWQLFAVCVLVWSTTWYAITFQIGRISPEFGVALRFGLAGAAILAFCASRGMRLVLPARDHALLALQGSFMYGFSYLGVYHAEQHVVSGLVAVGFSASPLVVGIGAWLVFGTRLTRRFATGGVLCVVGVTLIFWRELGASHNADTVLGALFTVASVLLSGIGSLAASLNGRRGMPFWPALGLGMLYGAATCAVVGIVAALEQGQVAGVGSDLLAASQSLSWWVSLLYLSLAGSVLTFACFLTLQQRIGPAPAGTVGVMTPLLALGISMVFEHFRPEALTFIGAALAVLGNVLILRPRR